MAHAVRVALDVSRTLDRLGVRHVLTGSLVSSLHGIPRMTRDVDFVVELEPARIEPLVAAFEADYYVDAGMVRDALRRGTMFNLAHFATLMKVDLHVPRAAAYEREQMKRRQSVALGTAAEDRVPALSPEDIVLQKLRWFDQGGRVSDQQWRDVLGVLQVRAGGLDESYLDEWSQALGLVELLERAREQARLR